MYYDVRRGETNIPADEQMDAFASMKRSFFEKGRIVNLYDLREQIDESKAISVADAIKCDPLLKLKIEEMSKGDCHAIAPHPFMDRVTPTEEKEKIFSVMNSLFPRS